MILTKKIFMVRWYDEINQTTNHDEVMEEELINYLFEHQYEVIIEGNYELEFKTDAENEELLELQSENEELKEKLERICDNIETAIDYLQEAESDCE